MDRRNADPGLLDGGIVLPVAPPPRPIEPCGDVGSDEPEVDHLLNYQPVPPRQSHTVLVRIRQGDRLRPLTYPLEEEESWGREGDGRRSWKRLTSPLLAPNTPCSRLDG